jgi:hypothetical protein
MHYELCARKAGCPPASVSADVSSAFIPSNEREGCRKRPQHHDELVDQPRVIGVQEVAALELAIADPGREHEGVIGGASGADLACVAKVLEDASHRCQHDRDLVAASVGLEDDRAAKDDVLVEERDKALEILRLNGCSKLVHVSRPFMPG